ncbi:hypothetical protein FB451DRAFT_1245124 [Mycena latifolia]|nr:hypothetical protein FB451DRAFT_1245124 [Mycena latifolia]
MFVQRLTPLEAIADLLSETHPLRSPIRSRIRVPLDSARDLLQQLDDVWLPLTVQYPDFPSDYPPNLPPFLDADTLCTAFDGFKNPVLEWLGDSFIAAALATCAHRSIAAWTPLLNDAVIRYLASGHILAHMALLYGLQLHDYSLADPQLPSMERMGDVFESLVGAAAGHLGGPLTLGWLEQLFEPWVKMLSETSDFIPSALNGVQSAETKYKQRLSRMDEPPLPLRPIVFKLDTVLTGQWPLSVACTEDIHALIAGYRHGWQQIDASRVCLPPGYPPPPPPPNSLNLLTDALTDIFCRLQWPGVTSNEKYRALGDQICYAVVTQLAVTKLPVATPAELDDVRLECTNRDLVARLGLLYNLHEHLRVLRGVKTPACVISPTQSRGALWALVGLIYDQVGWDRTMVWLDPLFSPWILAAADGTFRASSAAEAQRQDRIKKTRVKNERIEKRLKKEAEERELAQRLKQERRVAQRLKEAQERKLSEARQRLRNRTTPWRARYSTTVPSLADSRVRRLTTA